MSLTQDDHGPHHPHSGSASAPRRKQARPRRRSGDSVGAASSSLDLTKADSPTNLHTFRKSPGQSHHMDVDNAAPENLSLKRPSSSPAINLVKTESLMEDHSQHNGRDKHNLQHSSPSSSAGAGAGGTATPPGTPASTTSTSEHPFHQLDRAAQLAGLHHHVGEHEARVEALQVILHIIILIDYFCLKKL